MCVCVHAQGVRGGGLDLWACRLVTKKAPEEKQRRGRGRGSGRKVFLQFFFSWSCQDRRQELCLSKVGLCKCVCVRAYI